MNDHEHFEFDTGVVGSPPVSKIRLSDEKKADVLTQYWMSLRARVGVWEDRAYRATVWSVGLVFSATGYCLLHPEDLAMIRRLVVGVGFIIFGALTQSFLFVAKRSHRHTGMAIDRVQAALRLCEENEYLSGERFCGYSGRYLPPRMIMVLQWLHLVAIAFALAVLLFVR